VFSLLLMKKQNPNVNRYWLSLKQTSQALQALGFHIAEEETRQVASPRKQQNILGLGFKGLGFRV
jgi:hypothetical protein